MVTKHATIRGIERIDNKKKKKNKKVNLKKIMRKDAYKRYFAYAKNRTTIYRYVLKDNSTYKYILNIFNNKIITVYEVNFDEELKKYHHIGYVRNINDI